MKYTFKETNNKSHLFFVPDMADGAAKWPSVLPAGTLPDPGPLGDTIVRKVAENGTCFCDPPDVYAM